MIPPIIHYCWFGKSDKNKLVHKCINSWRKKLPEYQIIEWNELNVDLKENPYLEMCYGKNKYAFLTDYLRLKIIYEHGGIYFDTDVEVVKSFDHLLQYAAFFGYETDEYINTGQGFGAEAGNEVIKRMLDAYLPLLDGNHDVIGCPILNTAALVDMGFRQNGKEQRIGNAIILPKEYFNPYDDATGRLNITNNTYSIHWYGKSWMTKSSKLRCLLTRPLHRILGIDFFRKHNK